MRRRTRSRLAVAFLAAVGVSAGCSRRSGPATVLIKINGRGLATVDGEAAPPDDLYALLRERAAATVQDIDGLPALSVSISAAPECRYRHVQDAMIQCMRAYIWRISWEMNGRSLDASQPWASDFPVYVHEEIEDPGFVHDETETTDGSEAPAASRLAEIPELSEGHAPVEALYPAAVERRAEEPPGAEADPDAAREAGESANARRAVVPDRCVRVLRAGEPSPELRVRLSWENGDGRAIFGPTAPMPYGGFDADPAVSTSGAHVVVKVNGVTCADFDDLERKLDALANAIPEAYVVLDASSTVPFEQVFRALEACRRSDVEKELFQAPPPAPESADDWWWL
ncbi:MAG: ExbD/TolR family protein [Planctomycetota bacterium]|jgi:biopolymer transport protein ExbD